MAVSVPAIVKVTASVGLYLELPVLSDNDLASGAAVPPTHPLLVLVEGPTEEEAGDEKDAHHD